MDTDDSEPIQWTQTDINEANSLAAISAPDEREVRYLEFRASLYRAGRAFKVEENNVRCGIIQHEGHYAVTKLRVVPQTIEGTKIYTAYGSSTLCCEHCVVPPETIKNYYRAFIVSVGFTPDIISHDVELGESKPNCADTVADNLRKIGAHPPTIRDRSASETPTTRDTLRIANKYLASVLNPMPSDMYEYIREFKRVEGIYQTILVLDGYSTSGPQWNYERAISVSTEYFRILKDIRDQQKLYPPYQKHFEKSVEVLVHFTYYIAERLLNKESLQKPKMQASMVLDITEQSAPDTMPVSQLVWKPLAYRLLNITAMINNEAIEVYRFVKDFDNHKTQSAHEWAREMRRGAIVVIRLLLKVADIRGLSYVNSIFVYLGKKKLSGMRNIGKCHDEEKNQLWADAQAFLENMPDIPVDPSLPVFPQRLLSTMLASAENVHLGVQELGTHNNRSSRDSRSPALRLQQPASASAPAPVQRQADGWATSYATTRSQFYSQDSEV